jgi:DEAD/DEAH box helicase domain-containing protein
MCDTIDRESGEPIRVFTYDGDTPQDARRSIRSRAHLVLSNPDMVHSGILPHHPRWAKLFENLRYVIIDELHAYRGVSEATCATSCGGCGGSAALRVEPGVPLLVGDDREPAGAGRAPHRTALRARGESGAPRGEKFFVFVQPAGREPQLGIRRSYLGETRRRVASRVPQAHSQMIVLRRRAASRRDPDDLL